MNRSNSIDYFIKKLSLLDMYVGLDSFKTKSSSGAKIMYQVRPCIS